ncbi:hypothetical protein EJ03DRAFT_363351 [Teratosphaeria nubilosa]|uniref:FAD/NAD(P)-binding domain-containing protein n=1 Tax=Teratosphaeria nubilosa TaxID=161662 RepID=A0A6G1L840_9PEZI|nr:hypothetical protein EJ03DRAFT_363351 [Teratosphaeria nubilosa]
MPAITKKTPGRSNATVSGPYGCPDEYAAVVVGAGPAGVTVVGNLLERKVEPILWVDDGFDGGRVNRKYREVPSNTKVALFIDFATAVAPFRKIVSGVPGKDDKLQDLRSLDQGKGCQLSHAADMVLMLTEGLKRTPGVVTQQGKMVEAVLDDVSGKWDVKIDPSNASAQNVTSAKAQRVVLCTGSSPSTQPFPGNVADAEPLDLDEALSPTKLSKLLSPLGPTTVSVIGASHSAILVLRNLYNLASSSKPDLKIRWFTRHALRYAEYMDGWILRDNTGLKGEVAVWAKQHLEPEVFPDSPVSQYIEAISYDKQMEQETFHERLPGSDFICQAIGYNRDPIPTLKTSSGKEITPYYDHEKGSFTYVKESGCGTIGNLAPLPGVYGAGIAWPERVKDPHGNVEYAVGFFKFMKYIKRVSPEWN